MRSHSFPHEMHRISTFHSIASCKKFYVLKFMFAFCLFLHFIFHSIFSHSQPFLRYVFATRRALRLCSGFRCFAVCFVFWCFFIMRFYSHFYMRQRKLLFHIYSPIKTSLAFGWWWCIHCAMCILHGWSITLTLSLYSRSGSLFDSYLIHTLCTHTKWIRTLSPVNTFVIVMKRKR